MTVKMTPEMEKLVEEKLQAGDFATAEEVLLAGLLSLPRHDEGDFGAPEHLRITSVEQLNKLLEEGERSIAEDGTLDVDDAFAQLRAERLRDRSALK